MEIGPVADVRIAPMIRSKETDLGLRDVDEIERTARIGDETYSPNGIKAAAGFDDENDQSDDEADEADEGNEADDLEDSPEAVPQVKATTNGKIDYFA
jgi:hypothetical protein